MKYLTVAICLVLTGCLHTERTWSGVDEYGHAYTVVEREPSKAFTTITVTSIVATAYTYIKKK